jgi:hypothetical protein
MDPATVEARRGGCQISSHMQLQGPPGRVHAGRRVGGTIPTPP